jgi:hypothetical protein
MTFSDGICGMLLTGRRFTQVSFWSARASRSSSSCSEVGKPNMMPFLMAAALLGKEVLIFFWQFQR